MTNADLNGCGRNFANSETPVDWRYTVGTAPTPALFASRCIRLLIIFALFHVPSRSINSKSPFAAVCAVLLSQSCVEDDKTTLWFRQLCHNSSMLIRCASSISPGQSIAKPRGLFVMCAISLCSCSSTPHRHTGADCLPNTSQSSLPELLTYIIFNITSWMCTCCHYFPCVLALITDGSRLQYIICNLLCSAKEI